MRKQTWLMGTMRVRLVDRGEQALVGHADRRLSPRTHSMRAPVLLLRLPHVHHRGELLLGVDDLVRARRRSRCAEAMIAWIIDTFWCITTEPAGALRIFATCVPDLDRRVPPALAPGAHAALRPLVGVRACSFPYTPSGIAPRLWFHEVRGVSQDRKRARQRWGSCVDKAPIIRRYGAERMRSIGPRRCATSSPRWSALALVAPAAARPGNGNDGRRERGSRSAGRRPGRALELRSARVRGRARAVGRVGPGHRPRPEREARARAARRRQRSPDLARALPSSVPARDLRLGRARGRAHGGEPRRASCASAAGASCRSARSRTRTRSRRRASRARSRRCAKATRSRATTSPGASRLARDGARAFHGAPESARRTGPRRLVRAGRHRAPRLARRLVGPRAAPTSCARQELARPGARGPRRAPGRARRRTRSSSSSSPACAATRGAELPLGPRRVPTVTSSAG